MTVDLGSFLSSVVAPVVSAVQKFTEPLNTVAHVLTDPLPGITDVTNALGMAPITVASLLGVHGPTLNAFASTIEFINSIQIPAAGSSLKVDVGSFNILDARKANSPATNFNENSAVKQHGLLGAAGGSSTYTDLQTKADFDFPMLDNPVSFVSSVLLGQKVALVKANLGVGFTAAINDEIPIIGIPDVGSLDLNLFGSAKVDAAATFVLTDNFLVGGSVLGSLQVQNAHMDVTLTVGIGGGVTVAGFHAFADGTIGINFDVTLSNKTPGATTITGNDLLDGNATLNVSQAVLQVGIHVELDDPFGDDIADHDFPLWEENLMDGSAIGGGGTGGGGGGGGGGPSGGGGGHRVLQ